LPSRTSEQQQEGGSGSGDTWTRHHNISARVTKPAAQKTAALGGMWGALRAGSTTSGAASMLAQPLINSAADGEAEEHRIQLPPQE